MSRQVAARLYIMFVGAVAVITTAFLFSVDSRSEDAERWVLWAGLAALMVLVTYRPLHFGFRITVVLNTVVVFALVLLFEPGMAALAAGAGTLVAHLLRRDLWDQTLFNTSEVTLQAVAAGLVLAAFGWSPADPTFGDAGMVLAILLAALTIFVVNSILVSFVIGLQAGLPPYLVWRETVNGELLLEQANQFALGLVAAIIVDVQIWILPVLIFPALTIYLSLKHQLQLRFQTLDALSSLADLVDRRDPYTANHSRRVAVYARALAIEMGLDPAEVDQVARAARVHDLGKILIDSDLMNKQGRLSSEEWDIFLRHPEDGAQILRWFPEFERATDYVRHHHERVDGSGYPAGLSGDRIPVGARIISVADGLDAMATPRPYRPGLSAAMIRREFQYGRGSQWDGAVVDALFNLLEAGMIVIPGKGSSPVAYDNLGPVIEGRDRRFGEGLGNGSGAVS